MPWSPVSGLPIQYSEDASGTAASGNYLKFYASGTTTPISMATDSTGATTLAKCQLNSLGQAINGSSAVFIPHIDQKYKAVLYPDSTTADANTFASAIWVVDGITDHGSAVRQSGEYVKDFDTMAAAAAATTLVSGDVLLIKDRANTHWDVVASSGVTENTYNIVQGENSLSLVLRDEGIVNLAAWGSVQGTSSNGAIRAAIAYGITNNLPVYVPSGLPHIVTKLVTIQYLNDDESLVMYGDGETSVIQLADDAITADFDRMFIFDVTSGHAADSIIIRNILFDNNTRGNVGPATTAADSTYEHCHAITVRGTSGTIRHVEFDHVGIKDPCADGINVAGTAGNILNFLSNDCYAFDRTRLRRDIQFSLPPRVATIKGFRGSGIECEHETGSDTVGKCYLNISDTIVNIIDILGLQSTSDPDYFEVNLKDVDCLDLNDVTDNNYAGARGAAIGACLLKVDGGKMLLANSKQWIRLRKGSVIRNVEFYHEIDPDTSAITPLTLRDVETAYASDTTVENCTFTILSDNPAYTAPANSSLIDDPTPKVGSGYIKRIKNCTFDPRIDFAIDADRSGKWIIDGCKAGGQTAFVFCGAGATYQTNVQIGDVDCTDLVGGLVSVTGSAETTLNLYGEHIGSAAANIVVRSGSAATVTATSSRTIVGLSAVTSEGWKGDRIASNSPTYVTEWTCSATSSSAATWRATKWLCGKNTTANRPTLTASDVGVSYLDTTLDADGKLIWYTGTAWVDATGATV